MALYKEKELNHKIKKPLVSTAFRQFWAILSKFFSNWKATLVVVKSETVIHWHKTAFKIYWRKKSRKSGRPKISLATIALIKRIHKENPLLSPEKIFEKLRALNISDAPCPNTIAKYIPKIRKSPTDKQRQSWRTFLKNHCKNSWGWLVTSHTLRCSPMQPRLWTFLLFQL